MRSDRKRGVRIRRCAGRGRVVTVEQLRYELLKKVYAAAVDVCEWDWADNDEEPQKSIQDLKAAVAAMESLDRVENFAQE